MSRPRTPTAQLEARGAFVKNPQRKRTRHSEPQPTAFLGDPPKHLKANEKNVWRELAAKLVRGVAANSDEAAFETLVCLISDFRQRRRRRVPQPVGEYTAMTKLYTLFGMTPADRSKVSAGKSKGKEKDPFEEWDEQTSPVN